MNFKMIVVMMLALSGCQTAAHSKSDYHSCGNSSWYGNELRGRKTASGERFNPSKMTAAHKHLKFGTRVRVTNMKNHRSVVVTINDRGPFVRSRIIDLSKSASSSLGIGGTGKVCLTVVK